MIFSFASAGSESMDICTASTSQPRQIPNSDVTILEGHTSEVMCIIDAPYSVHLNFLSSIVYAAKLSDSCPVHHPFRCVLVHGVLQDLFLHQGGYFLELYA